MRRKPERFNIEIWKKLKADPEFNTNFDKIIVCYTNASPEYVDQLKNFLTRAPLTLVLKGCPVERGLVWQPWVNPVKNYERKRFLRHAEALDQGLRLFINELKALGFNFEARAMATWLSHLDRWLTQWRNLVHADQYYCPFNVAVVVWVKAHRKKTWSHRRLSFPWDRIWRVLRLVHRVRGSKNAPKSVVALQQACRPERYRRSSRGGRAPALRKPTNLRSMVKTVRGM